MNKSIAIFSVCTIVLLTGCADDSVDLSAETERLMQLSRDWSGIVNSGDIDAIVSHWHEEALILPPDSPIIEGKAAIRKYVESTSSIPGFRITWEPERAFISDAGDMAYMIERNEITFANESGEQVSARGKVVTVWKKNDSGEWQNVVDMWNSLPASED